MAKTINFKSTPENFRKEFLGLKCNTLRKCDNITDERFAILDNYIRGSINILYVGIHSTINEEYFEKLVTDVTKFDDYYIISWKHQ